ncbi:AT-rich interactive domain-containing protein 5A, partial [Nibea albiflora]
ASPSVIEIHDSMTECEEEARPSVVPMEEKAFVSSLHSFMKDRGTPIERIPHLGFKQINLWRIYKAVEKLGGYDSVTARRLWKKVYDELGGSPGSTSAATCTRRHYEKLVLPFERHIKGEEDKPLPPSKPRKPYKRNSDGKVHKAERKRKRTQSEREIDSEMLTQRSPEAACQSEAALHPHPALWVPPSDRHHPDCSQPNRATTNHHVYARLVQVPTSSPWPAHIPSAAGELPRPAPIRPGLKIHEGRLMQQDDSLTCAKKLTHGVTPWHYPTEKRDKSRTMLQKVPHPQQNLSHSTASMPVSCVLTSYDKSGRDSRHQPPLHPVFLPTRMRLPQSQLMYRHIPVSPAHSALIGPAVYPYPYTFPLLNPQTGYTLPTMSAIYPHK